MQKNKIIAPSTEKTKNLKDLLKFESEISSCANLLHVDIMDGKFVKRKLFSNKKLKKFVKQSKMPLDFHLMCSFLKNTKKLNFYISLKPEIISVHFEAFENTDKLKESLQKIKNAGIKVGLAIKLETEINQIFQFLPLIDLVLIMSVKVGYGGQQFDKIALKKLELLQTEIKKNNLQILVQVDGGINNSNAKTLFENGADILVCGSFIYGSVDRCKTIKMLKE